MQTVSQMLLHILAFMACIYGIAQCYHYRCGIPPKPYFPNFQECKNGSIFWKQATEQTTPLSETKKKKPDEGRISLKPPDPADDILNCTYSMKPGRTKGRKCCGGFQTYNPAFDTCCLRNPRDAFVYRNKPEKKYVCCENDPNTVYERGSRDMPCKLPSVNDKLFRKQSKLRQLTNYCSDYMFVFTVRLHSKLRPQHTGFSQCYNATVTRWSWNSANDKTSIEMYIPIDRYTPKLNGKSNRILVVLSNHDYTQDLDFYLNRSKDKKDTVFKGPKNSCTFMKNFRKLFRMCQRKRSLATAYIGH